jgi:radical SAM protein with 4Fe4S-binding SPASM domain
MMDIDILLKFMRENYMYLSDIEFKIMGGEPTLHPRFYEVIEEACRYYRLVSLFTNGSTMPKIAKEPLMIKHHFSRKLQYLINGFTFDIDKFGEYREFVHSISLHCVVPINNVNNFIEKVLTYSQRIPNVFIAISPDTQINLFDDDILNKYRTAWTKSLTNIVPALLQQGTHFGYDHNLPICFFTQEMIDDLHKHNIGNLYNARICCCGEITMGLIDYNFDLYFCNQTRLKIGSILNREGNPKTLDEITHMLQGITKVKADKISEMSDKCKECRVLSSCKVGCYYNALCKGDKIC